MIEFRSKITIKILGYLFLNPQKKHYVNEFAKILEVDPGNLFRKLKEMENEGILVSENRGNQRYFWLNKKYRLLNEIKRTYEAKYGIVDLLKKKLAGLKGLQEAYIFGSFAGSVLKEESDIDILLVGGHSSIEAKRAILPLQKITGREINIIDLSLEEMKSRRKNKDDFIKNIFSRKFIKIF